MAHFKEMVNAVGQCTPRVPRLVYPYVFVNFPYENLLKVQSFTSYIYVSVRSCLILSIIYVFIITEQEMAN